jgi:hypothetical protein
MTKGHVNTMCYCVLRYTARIEIQKEESKLKKGSYSRIGYSALHIVHQLQQAMTAHDATERSRERERERERQQQTSSETALSRARYERALHPRDPTNHRVRLD